MYLLFYKKNAFLFMYSNDKLRYYIFIFLTFCVLSSKNIIIYNEETLVALSFFCFIFFISKYFGNTIQDSLNERSQVIQQELQNFLNIKFLSFQELLKQHQKISNVVITMKTLDNFTTKEIVSFKDNGTKILRNIVTHQIQQKLKALGLSKLMVQQKLQFSLSENILSNVLLVSQTLKTGAKSKHNHQRFIRNALDLLVANTKQR